MSLRDAYLLRPDVVFLNHGSFGAAPRPVFEQYQKWQLELELEPVDFLGRKANDLMIAAREALGGYIHADRKNIVFVTNATTGVNIVARSLRLKAGDEILSTDHEYGAMDRTWRFTCEKVGATYINRRLPYPIESREQFVDTLFAGVTDRTRVIFLSHITSPTALIFPIEEVCRRARQAGILTVIDGAHAPGQIPLDMERIGADFYTGNCHKWLSAAKGAGFLFARPEVQPLLEPLVVSWGWRPDVPGESLFIDHHTWLGTRDIASFLSVPAAIEFQRAHDWGRIQAECHALAAEFRRRTWELCGKGAAPQLCPDSPEWYAQMVSARIPACDVAALSKRLWEERRIEIPIIPFNGVHFARASFQAYNSREDLEKVVAALTDFLPLAG